MINTKKSADKLFMNGVIYTMDKENPVVEAMAISEDKILFAGEKDTALRFASDNCEIIDLQGKMLLPGFIDAHAHPLLSSFWLSGLMISIDLNKEEVIKGIKDYIKANPGKKSYFGIGYAEWIFDSKGPVKEDLDAICSEKPVLILGSSGHEGWCNSLALELSGITKNTPDPIPGLQYFERNEEGIPTGHLVECETIGILCRSIDFFKRDNIKNKLEQIFDDYSGMGVTSIVDCGCFDYFESLVLPIVTEFEKGKKLKQRIFGSAFVENLNNTKNCISKLQNANAVYDSDEFRIRTLKIVNDGTIESRSASLNEPYDEDQSLVEPMLSGSELYSLCVEAAQQGYDIHIHAIGDKSIHETLMAAKAIREAGFIDTRITNAHTDYVAKQDRELFGKYNVIANTTGVWHYGNPSMNPIIGDRADEQFMMLSLIKSGALLSLGSDLPVDEYGAEPLKGIQMAVTRQLYGKLDAPVLKPENEKLTVQRCLEGYTINAAYQVHMEDKIGIIQEGKYADFVVLEKNIFKIDPNEIYTVAVEMTFKGGKCTYKKLI